MTGIGEPFEFCFLAERGSGEWSLVDNVMVPSSWLDLTIDDVLIGSPNEGKRDRDCGLCLLLVRGGLFPRLLVGEACSMIDEVVEASELREDQRIKEMDNVNRINWIMMARGKELKGWLWEKLCGK